MKGRGFASAFLTTERKPMEPEFTNELREQMCGVVGDAISAALLPFHPDKRCHLGSLILAQVLASIIDDDAGRVSFANIGLEEFDLQLVLKSGG
jgi:hypothetical protein